MKYVHLPGLNGLRAIAALAVVIYHITTALGRFGLNPYILGTNYNGAPEGLSLGVFGVSIFFVLSGFLITYLLLLEKETAGIRIQKFYIRRILRIWPLYYLYLFICIAVGFFAGMKMEAGNLALYTFFAANIPFILGGTLPLVGHYWSLGVEEQFYLLWPWVLKKSTQRLFFIVCTFIVAIMALKFFARFLTPGKNFSLLYQAIHVTRFHCMLIGAAGAILYSSGHSFFLRATTNKYTQLFAWAVIGLIAINKFHVAAVIDQEMVSLITVVLIVGQIGASKKIINLENPVFDFLGMISYGIYVIHPLLIFGAAKLIGALEINSILKYFLVYCGITASTILLSYLSYEYFEKWFLRLKHRYSVVMTSATREGSESYIPRPVPIYTEE